jgi:ribonucleotide reductase alpha subunit
VNQGGGKRKNNLLTNKSSNLCTEIVQYTFADAVAVYNLASINLRAFVNKEGLK